MQRAESQLKLNKEIKLRTLAMKTGHQTNLAQAGI